MSSPTPIPILLYHSVSEHPSPGLAPFTVAPAVFADQLGLCSELGCSPLTVTELVSALRDGAALPERPLVLTFDDAYVDFLEVALPALLERGLSSTLYVATGLVPGPHRPQPGPEPLGPILGWPELQEIAAAERVEIGAHSHTHPHLDTLSAAAARSEIELSKRLLEEELQREIETFAYPNGYSSAAVRRLVREAGFDGACAVRNALSSPGDDRFALARLTVRSTTTVQQLRGWLTGAGAPVAPFPERVETRAWRAFRRARAIATRTPGSDLVTPGAGEAAFRPARLLEVELASPLEPIPQRAPDGSLYERALLLATLHGVPLGVVELELPAAGLEPAPLRDALSEALAGEIARHCALDGIEPSELGTAAATAMPACRREQERVLAEAPPVTVAIATRDRHAELEACLRSLAAAAGAPLEVIVVDNAPASGAAAVVERVGEESGLPLRYELEPVVGKSIVHNRALALARGEIVAFLDDDVLVHPAWLPELLRGFEASPDVACVTGAIIPFELETAAQGWLEQFGGYAKGFERQLFDPASAPARGPLYPYAAGMFGSGANMAFRAADLRAIGGFDPTIGAGTPTLGGEDLAAFFAVVSAGKTLVYQPQALVLHRHRRDYESLRRTTFGYGVALTALLTKAVLDEPARLRHLVRAAPRGLVHGLGSQSPKNRGKLPDYPRELTWRERSGMAAGPFAYLWSRWRRRSLSAPPGRSRS